MRCDAVIAVGPEGAALARLLPVGAEHEVIDNELAPPTEEIAEREIFALRPVEAVILVDREPWHLTPLGAELIAQLGEVLFFGEQLPASGKPVVIGSGGMIGHGPDSMSRLGRRSVPETEGRLVPLPMASRRGVSLTLACALSRRRLCVRSPRADRQTGSRA